MGDHRAEDLFLEADQLISDGKYREAKELLLELLADYPDYGRAHNHLGWLYNVKFNNYNKSKQHFELALKFAPDYHAVYGNYSFLLIDMNMFDEMIAFGNRVVNNKIADQATIYNKMGQAYELKGDVMGAFQFYKKSISSTINNKYLEDLYASITRVKGKMTLLQKLKVINQ